MLNKVLRNKHGWMLAMALLGCALAAKPSYYLVRQQWLNYRAQQWWTHFKQEGQEPRSGDPIAWISSPKAGVNNLILWDVTEENLRKFPSWSRLSAGPQQRGLGMIFGHRDAHFRHLAKLEIGDEVTMEDVEGMHEFRVSEQSIIPREDLGEALIQDKPLDHGLVLVTCYPFRYAGPAPQRLLVWLEPIENAALLDAASVASLEKCVSE